MEKEWTESLEATGKQDGSSIKTASFSSKGELMITLSDGTDGQDGADGKNGVNGANGTDGKNGKDGTNGIDGQDGISLTKTEINSNGELVIYYSNGTKKQNY